VFRFLISAIKCPLGREIEYLSKGLMEKEFLTNFPERSNILILISSLEKLFKKIVPVDGIG
jgi:hypothetical protein